MFMKAKTLEIEFLKIMACNITQNADQSAGIYQTQTLVEPDHRDHVGADRKTVIER